MMCVVFVCLCMRASMLACVHMCVLACMCVRVCACARVRVCVGTSMPLADSREQEARELLR